MNFEEDELNNIEAELIDDQEKPDKLPFKTHLVLGEEHPLDKQLVEKTLSEDVVYKGIFFNIDRLQVELPNHEHSERDVLRHPGAVAIVALSDEGDICLVRQYRPSLSRVTVEIPAGKLDPGETPDEAARRELLEETGLVADKMAYLSSIATAAGFADELIHIYMATGLRFVGQHTDVDEFVHVDLVPLEELVDAVLDGRIEDSKTVIGALLCDAISRRLS